MTFLFETMEREELFVSGSDLITARTKLTKDLPLIGLKEFEPDNSWLQGKQIQKSLEERHDLLKQEHIERESSLSCAKWMPDLKKAKVLRQTGKIWESFGHHKDDHVWLMAEEALYLLETNDLELFYDDIRLSIERSYAILLHPSNGCSLEEYRTYSFLLNNGFKVIRHSPDVTITRYEKKINLDQRVTSQKRIAPDVVETSNGTEVPQPQISDGDVMVDIETVSDSERISSQDSDVILIEEDKEVIIIEDSSPKKDLLQANKTSVVRHVPEVTDTRNLNTSINADLDIICLDDDDDDNNVDDTEKREWGAVKKESTSTESSSDSDDVVYIGQEPKKFGKRENFIRRKQFLQPQVQDSSNEDVIEVVDHLSEPNKLGSDKADLAQKSRDEILRNFPNAEESVTTILCPDLRLLPANIVPRFSEYRVNLNIRRTLREQQRRRSNYWHHRNNYSPHFQGSNSYTQLAREHSHYSPRVQGANTHTPHSHAVNSYSSQNQGMNNYKGALLPVPHVDTNLVRKAKEMQNMALGLLQVASSLIYSANASPLWPQNGLLPSHLNTSPMDGHHAYDNRSAFGGTPLYSNTSQAGWRQNFGFQRRYQGRSGFQRRSYYQRRPWRGGYQPRRWNQGSYRNSNDLNQSDKQPEIIMLDSDDDDDVTEVKFISAKDKKDESLECSQPKRVKTDSSPELMAQEVSNVEVEESKSGGAETDSRATNEPVKTESVKSEIVDVCSSVDSNKTPALTIEVNNEVKTEETMDSTDLNKEVKGETSSESVEVLGGSDVEMNIGKTKNEEAQCEENETSSISCNNEMSGGDEANQDVCLEVLENHDDVDRSEQEPPVIINVENWEQYKMFQDRNGRGVEDHSDVAPLLRPGSSDNIENILSSIQIFGSFEKESPTKMLKISFDIFVPGANFKKSMKLLPNFRAIVLSADDEVPTASELSHLQDLYQDDIPFLFCVVLEESVSFYLFSTVFLPVLIN